MDVVALAPIGTVNAGDYKKAAELERQLATVNRQAKFFIRQYTLAVEVLTKRAIRTNTRLELNEAAFDKAIKELAALMLLAFLTSFNANLPTENTLVRFSKYVDQKAKDVAEKLRDKSKKIQEQLQKQKESLRSFQKTLRETEKASTRYTSPTGRKRARSKAAELRTRTQSAREKVVSLQAKTAKAKVDLGALSKRMEQLAGAPVRESLHSVRKRVNESLDELQQTNMTKPAKVREITKRLKEMGVSPKSPSYVQTIVNTHTQLTFGIGQRIAYEDDDGIELLKYMTMEDAKVRPAHQKLHGLVAAKDNPIWNKIWPPNGWNCRCWVVPVSANSNERPSRIPTNADLVPDTGFRNNARKIVIGK